ncbi:MAG: 4-hydroxybenzoate octaprenyltransferase [Alphaproteobacteria bacterium]|nr:4-hydroxybenzoate octaprenyltransferase [Alphaproteobacteria bacterium]
MESHSDIKQGDWVDRRVPFAFRPFVRLARLDRPVGIWLLLLPCWWGLFLPEGILPFERFAVLVLFGIGAVVMRSAGCVVNDLYDRRLDRQVERTRVRPLAAGDVSVFQALVLLFVLLLMGLGVLLLFNRPTFWLGVFSLVFVFFYPLAKRFCPWPQVVLGLAFNWGALMGWSALTGQALSVASGLLYSGGVFWTLAYDTIYAFQDKDDDEKVGVYSMALCLGDRPRFWIFGFYAAALTLFALAGFMAGLHGVFYVGLLFAFLFAGGIVKCWRVDHPADCLARFRANQYFGLLVLFSIMMGRLFS